MKKQKPSDKPQSEMSEAERIEAWRRKRLAQGSLEKPKARKGEKKEDKD